MQTIYCTTANITSTPVKVVDLEDYRARLAQRGGLEAPVWEGQSRVVSGPWAAGAGQSRTRRRSLAAGLDLWCSLGVIVMTLTFTLRVLAL